MPRYIPNPFLGGVLCPVEENVGPLGDLEFLTGDSGGAVGPDAGSNITISGNPDIDVVGTAGTNSFQLTNLTKWTPYVVDSVAGAAPYQTIQSALDAANTAGGSQIILIRPGTYTENLTFYSSLSILGEDANVDTLAVKIIGVHTPPTDNATITFRNINFYGTTAIFSSAAAGETYLAFDTCNFILSAAGYVFDMDNWVGPTGLVTGIAGIALDNSGDLSTADSGTFKISNGTSGVVVLNSYVGSLLGGGTMPMIVKGTVQLSISDVFCPVQLTGGTGTFIEQTNFHVDGITVSGASSGSITDSTFLNLTTAAFTMNSAASWILANNVIDTSNNPAIAGTGAGTLTIGDITFIDNAAIAGTVTVAYATATETGTVYAQNLSFNRGTSTIDTNGQLVIGSTGNNPQIATLTAGTGISVTNGAGSITVATAGTTIGTGTTLGAVTANLITINLGVIPGTYHIQASIAGYDSDLDKGIGYRLTGAVRTNGANATLVGTPDRVINEDAQLATAEADIVVSGNNVIIQVTGVVARTIRYRAKSETVFSS